MFALIGIREMLAGGADGSSAGAFSSSVTEKAGE